MDFLKKINYCVIKGSANSGKTTHFLNNDNDNFKIIISVFQNVRKILPLNSSIVSSVEKNCFKKIVLNINNCEKQVKFLYYNICNNYKISKIIRVINVLNKKKKIIDILIDEIFLFEKESLKKIEKLINYFINCNYFYNLYFTSLTTSWDNTRLKNTEIVETYANSFIIIKSYCVYCFIETVHSFTLKETSSTIETTKSLYFPCCIKCKNNFF